jgi:hypothetical protein
MMPSPYIGIMSRSATLMLRMVEQLGFCPTARVGLGQGDERETDPEDSRWIKLEGLRMRARLDSQILPGPTRCRGCSPGFLAREILGPVWPR